MIRGGKCRRVWPALPRRVRLRQTFITVAAAAYLTVLCKPARRASPADNRVHHFVQKLVSKQIQHPPVWERRAPGARAGYREKFCSSLDILRGWKSLLLFSADNTSKIAILCSGTNLSFYAVQHMVFLFHDHRHQNPAEPNQIAHGQIVRA